MPKTWPRGWKTPPTLKRPAVVTLPTNYTYIFSPIWLGITEQGETFGWEFDNIFIAPIWKNFSYQFIFAMVLPRRLKDAKLAASPTIQPRFRHPLPARGDCSKQP